MIDTKPKKTTTRNLDKNTLSKLLLGFCFSIFFNGIGLAVDAQNLDSINVNETYENTQLKEVLDDVGNKYQVPFYFNSQWIPDTLYSIIFNEKPILLVVQELLQSTDLVFSVFKNNSIIIAPESLLSREFSINYFVQKNRQKEYLNDGNIPIDAEIINLGNGIEEQIREGFVITGILTDEIQGDTLSGATILVKDLEIAINIDHQGRFSLNLPGGLHVCELRMVGYESKTLGINILGSDFWHATLLPEATELEEILVRATADDSNVKSNIIGLTKLSPIELKEMPVFLGEPDVIKSILTLPGVSVVGEGASGFNVRGGNIDQNLILQDNSLIFNSSHALGFFSIFNPDAIKEVTLYKGHIPAQYGGRVSSVLDVKLKGNNYETVKANGGIGLLASRFTIESPLVKQKSSLLLGGRVAYSDWILNFVQNQDVKNSSLWFYDFNAKISQRIAKNGNVDLSFYRSHDRFYYSDQFGFSWDSNNLSLRWDQVIDPDIISELTLSMSKSRNTTFQPEGIDAYNLGNGMNNYNLKEDILITSFKKHTINAGIEFNAYIPEDETYRPYNENSTVIPFTGMKDRGLESAIYFNDAIDLLPSLSMSLGLRYSLYSQLGPSKVYFYEDNAPSSPEAIIDSTRYDDFEKVISYDRLDPRFSLRYSITANTSIKMSFNILHQYIHLVSNTTSALPIDYWQVSNTYLKPLKAANYSIGIFKNFKLNLWETSLEVYYRDMENVVDYKDFPQLYLNNHIETELISGKGRYYGIELFIKKKRGKFTGWLSYAYSRSMIQAIDEIRDESINNGDWFPSKLDQPHNLNIVGNYNINRTNQLSFNFTYVTGRPLTGPNSNYELDGYIIPNYSQRNEYRIPDYHRLDVSYTIKRGVFRTSKYNDSFTFSIYNLYGRKNAYSIYFKRDDESIIGSYKLSILGTMMPSVTYNFEF